MGWIYLAVLTFIMSLPFMIIGFIKDKYDGKVEFIFIGAAIGFMVTGMFEEFFPGGIGVSSVVTALCFGISAIFVPFNHPDNSKWETGRFHWSTVGFISCYATLAIYWSFYGIISLVKLIIVEFNVIS